MPQLQSGRHASDDAPDFLYFGLSLGGVVRRGSIKQAFVGMCDREH